jgi:hypothetical protein
VRRSNKPLAERAALRDTCLYHAGLYHRGRVADAGFGGDLGETDRVDWTLVWTAVAAVSTVLGVGVAVLAWRRPKQPDRPTPARHELLTVDVSYDIPVFDQPDGSQTLGGDLVGVTARNGTDRPVRATGWGVVLPGQRRMVVTVPPRAWEPRLPHWISPGDAATWYLNVDDVRRQAATLGCDFDEMTAYVSFADGREILAARGMPLK